MKSLTYAVLCLAALIGSALAHFHLPKGDLELKTYPKVSATEFSVIRQEALSLAAEDATRGAGRFEARYFELTCRGEPALLVDNLEHTPIWSIHGEWDRSIGGGVPVEHSRQMGRLLSEKGFEHRLTMVPKTGHGCRTPELFEQVILWLLAQKKERAPQHVALATYGLRHNRSYWVRIEQMIRYDRRSLVDARIEDDARVVGRTENVMALSLGPAGDGVDQTVIIDGQRLGRLGLERWRTFQRGSNGSWEIDADPAADYKRHGVSGPIGDLFYEPTVLVPGTTGTEEETFFNNWVASHAAGYFASRNGGVHRGGILGQNSVELSVVRDVELSEQMLAQCNLLLYGTASSNSILARFEGKIPVSFRDGTIHLADKTYSADGAAVFAVFAHVFLQIASNELHNKGASKESTKLLYKEKPGRGANYGKY